MYTRDHESIYSTVLSSDHPPKKQGIELTSSTEQRDTEGIKAAFRTVALLLKKKIKQLVHVTFAFGERPWSW